MVFSMAKVLRTGNFSQMFAGTLDKTSVAIEQTPKSQVDDSALKSLLKLGHRNVVKILHAEQDSFFKYANTHCSYSSSTCKLKMFCLVRYYALELAHASMDQLFLGEGHRDKFSGRLPSQKVALFELANGLNFIHSHHLVHRDIRPENVHIFLPSNHLGPVIFKWAGFSLFSSSTGTNQLNYLKDCQKLKGYLNWLSPELLQLFSDGEGSVNWKANDIFAAGCVIFFYLTGGIHPSGSGPEIVPNIKKMKTINSDGKKTVASISCRFLK